MRAEPLLVVSALAWVVGEQGCSSTLPWSWSVGLWGCAHLSKF